MKNPTVSVITPVYNTEKYLKQCVDSVLNQTYENIELILADDGSTDSCPQICDDYAASDSRVKVIHKKNSGQSDARNAALDIAEGDYLFFLDSDDYIREDAFQILFDRVISDCSDMAICNFLYFNGDNFDYEKITEELKTKL